MNPTDSLFHCHGAECPEKTRKKTRKLPLEKRSVRFHQIVIIEFPQVLGDHPYSAGAPLALGWEPAKHTAVTVDFYEFTRDPRRSKHQLYVNKEERLAYLLNSGWKLTEITAVLSANAQLKHERAASAKINQRGILKAMERTIKTVVTKPSKLIAAAIDTTTAAYGMRAPSA